MFIANVVWPALYYADYLTLWYVILPSIAIEAYFFSRAFCGKNFAMGLSTSIVANFVTTMCAVIPVIQFSALIPTLLHDYLINKGTFSFSGSVFNAVWIILFNTLVEYWAAFIFVKLVLYRNKEFEKNRKAWILVLVGNIITFALGILMPFIIGHKTNI